MSPTKSMVWRCLLVVAVSLLAVQAAAGIRSGLRGRVFRSSLSLRSDRVSTSDPANTPLTADAFLQAADEGAEGQQALVETWRAAVEAPQTHGLDQEVLDQTQAQAEHLQRHQETALLEKSFLKEGRAASEYEPEQWLTGEHAITPDPYRHLANQDGSPNDHNNIEGALGVQSAAIPWDYRHYSGRLNLHRKAEPLVYTPLVIGKDAEGKSAIDLTSLANMQYQSQRLSSNSQYSRALSPLTDYQPVQRGPTDSWLPTIPQPGSPELRNKKLWEDHFLDLYAPTPPPLLAPVAPQMRKRGAQPAFVETAAVELPSILRGGERVHSLVTPVLDSQQQPIAFHDADREDEQMRESVQVNMFTPASDDVDHPLVFLEQAFDVSEHPALADIDVDTPFPEAKEETFAW